MMIDWLSIKLAVTEEFEGLVKEYQTTQDRILRIGGDGSLQWEVSAWDSIRSDSHQLAFQATGSYIRIQGSPARIIGDGDNVFSLCISKGHEATGGTAVNQRPGFDFSNQNRAGTAITFPAPYLCTGELLSVPDKIEQGSTRRNRRFQFSVIEYKS